MSRKMQNIGGSGRKSSFTSEQIDQLISKVSENPKISAIKLRDYIAEKTGIFVSAHTIRCVLRAQNLWGRVARKEPLLSSKNIIARSCRTAEWANYTLRAWENVLFTDETKINPHDSDGRVIVWSKPKEAQKPDHVVTTVKHGGGSVMVWG